jgi:hypothetical protein
MAQLGRFNHTAANSTNGHPVGGASVTIYREGAIVNGAQSGVSPLSVSVRHQGKIKTSDTVVFVTPPGTIQASTGNVNSASSTVIVVSGFAGTLDLADGDWIVPTNAQPTLYDDDQANDVATNPLTTSSSNPKGLATCFLEAPCAYTYKVSGGGLDTTFYHGMVSASEAPAQIRYADNFAANSFTGGIFEAISDLPSAGGTVRLSGNRTYDLSFTVPITGNDITIEGAGNSTIVQMAHATGVHFFGSQGSGITGSRFTARNFKIEGLNSSKTNGRGFNFGTCSDCLVENVYIANTADAAIGTNAAGPSTTTRLRVINCIIDSPGDAASSDGYGIILNNANDCIIEGNYIANSLNASIFGFGTSANNIIRGNRVEAGENGIRWGSVGATCNHWTVVNNEIDGCSVDGIRADGSNAIVMGNRSINNTLSGIKCDGPMTSSVWSNNYCNSNGNKGIYLNVANGAVSDVQIMGNLCQSNAGDGIRISPTAGAFAMTNVAVKNNMCVQNGTYGVYVDTAAVASSFVIAHNVYRANTTADELLERAANNVYGPLEKLRNSGFTAASPLNIPGDGVYTITGTANITSITACPAGTIITLIFTDTNVSTGVTDGSNLKIAGNFVYTPDDTIQLVCDGTNWYELGRSTN